MSPGAVMRSATLVGTRAAGQERDMGSLAPSKLANTIVLATDPLLTLDNLKSVVMTAKRGRILSRSEFALLQTEDITDF